MKKFFFLSIAVLLLTGCSQLFSPPTPTPTLTPTSTSTPSPTPTFTPTPLPTNTPTITPTQDLIAQYQSQLPQKPDGFEWQFVPEVKMAVLVPDGWYFKYQEQKEYNLKAFYVTRENIDEVGRFTTGFTMFVFSDLDNPETFEQYIIQANLQASTTKELINAWDVEISGHTFKHYEILGEFPYETEINQYKTIHYLSLILDGTVYSGTFESPTSEWDQAIEKYGVVIMDHLVIFQ